MKIFGESNSALIPRRRLCPLDIPEIVECVFSFLNRSQLLFGASQVCKLWRSVSLGLIVHTAQWDTQNTKAQEDIFRQRQGTLRALNCNFQLHCGDEAVLALAKRITALPHKEQRQIRTLTVIDFNTHQLSFSPLVFAPLQNLTSIHVRAYSQWTIPVSRLLSAFPHLQELALGLNDPVMCAGSLLSRDPLDRPWPSSTRSLRVLTLESMLVDLDDLKSFLNVCSDLRELRLIGILPAFTSVQTQTIDRRLFFTHIAASCPRICALHFSEHHRHMGRKDFQAIWRAFPNLLTWGTLVQEFNPQEQSTTMARQFPIPRVNHLTTLELTIPQARDFDVGRKSAVLPRVWACRNLKSFHASIQASQASLGTPDGDCGDKVSRMAFAFLARCCPRLRDICIQRCDLRLTLESGLCLLSQLKDLERLTILTGSSRILQVRDLEWMSTLPVDQQSRWQRMREKIVMAGLRQSREAKLEDQRRHLAAETRAKEAASLGYITSAYLEEETIVYAITKASCLFGVVDTLEQLSGQRKRGESCWPELETLWLRPMISQDAAQRQEKEVVVKMRPQLAFQKR
ncbi:hypothetical protein EDD21DRAFT_413564 [Dissophora ornata]|nr:hypothetical protein EDD21DRAFT_413564 [Dissophora ornata]